MLDKCIATVGYQSGVPVAKKRKDAFTP